MPGTASFFVAREEALVCGQRVVGDCAVILICAGWLPQDEVFGWRLPLVWQ